MPLMKKELLKETSTLCPDVFFFNHDSKYFPGYSTNYGIPQISEKILAFDIPGTPTNIRDSRDLETKRNDAQGTTKG